METPGYLPLRDDREPVYYVHHSALAAEREEHCRGSVLMMGPIGLERTHAYLVWARAARAFALEGFEAMRFDYRGLGESGGHFEEATFDTWLDDARECFDYLAEKRPGRIALLGLRAGALVASRLFETRGDALLVWEPPSNGKAHLLEILRRKLAADYAEGGTSRKTRDDYVREMNDGSVVEVEGYPWTRSLLESALRTKFVMPRDRPARAIWTDGREREGHVSVRIQRPPFWLDSMVPNPDVRELVAASLTFLREALA
jgi:pimeloyl-ACP methyl ester carboxylesterase